jgi:hypothetical protein
MGTSGNVTDTYFPLFSHYPALFSVICHYTIQVPKLYKFGGLNGRELSEIRSNKSDK